MNTEIHNSIQQIMTLDGKGPFDLTIFGRGEDVIATTTVERVEGKDEWTWNKDNLREQIASVDSVRLLFESEDSRHFEFPVYLDEEPKTTEEPMPGARHEETQHSKPRSATSGQNFRRTPGRGRCGRLSTSR